MAKTQSKSAIQEVILKTKFGEVVLTNVGASIVSINVPDKYGNLGNIILSYSDTNDYLNNPYYLGSTIGRVAGRIGNGEFILNGNLVSLSKNDHEVNHLHGGFKSFSHQLFEIRNVSIEEDFASVDLFYFSKDGEEGYPGDIDLRVNYTFNHNLLTINYKAKSTAITPFNITNHSYFNLTGRSDKALSQKLFIDANQILQTDQNYIPNGKLEDVSNTVYDFNTLTSIAKQKKKLLERGFNQYYIFKKDHKDVELYDEISGRLLTLSTSYPGILFYSGDYLNDKFISCEGICLEAQYHPDAVNHANFPDVFLKPNTSYNHFIAYNFSVL